MIRLRPETRHTVVLLLGTGITTALGLAYGVYATRMLPEGSVGTFAHALSIVAFLQIALGPINGTVAKFTAEYAGKGELGRVRSLVGEVARRVARYGAIVLTLAVVVAFPLAAYWKYASPGPLILALLITFVTLLLSVTRGALRGLQRFGSLNGNTIFESACRLLVGLPLLMLWLNATAALSAYFVALMATLVLARRQLRGVWAGAAPVSIDGRSVRRFALPMFVLMLASAGFQNIDMLVVKRALSTADADAYGVAFYLTGRAVAVLVTPFNTLMLPMLANLHGAGRSTQSPFLRVCGYFILLAAIPLGLFFMWPGAIIHGLYGDRFTGAVALLCPLAVVRLMGHLCHMIGLAGAASGRFGFLYVYVIGFIAQAIALGVCESTASAIVSALLWIQALTLGMLIVGRVRAWRRSRGSP